MRRDWIEVPISQRMVENLADTELTRFNAAIENAFITENGGHSRFPGLVEWATLPGAIGPVYLEDWRDDLIAVTADGSWHRINEAGTAENVTGVPVSGGNRVMFAKTPSELCAAAGGQIVRFAGERSEILSDDAPEATHLGYIDTYLVANEVNSQRWWHSEAGNARVWNPLDVFTSGGNPDQINALIVTDFRELLVAGPDSIEQFERLSTGTIPFFRRWSVGEGLFAPYTLCFADNAAWGVNRLYEFSRFSGQIAQPQSDDINLALETVDDWSEAWTSLLHIKGQKFILLQIPRATNPYGTKGLTYIYDYRARRWSHLYDWSAEYIAPTRWPGWSYKALWGRHFVGGEGRIYEMKSDVYANAGRPQRMLGRTGQFSDLGEVSIDAVRMRVRRGVGSNTVNPKIRLRCNRDNRGFGRWVERSLGKAGDRVMNIEFPNYGIGHAWQFEWEVTDSCAVEIAKLEVLASPIGE